MAAGVIADLLVHVGADVKDATSGLDQVNDKVSSTGKGFGAAGLAMGAGAAAVVGGLGLAINSAANFEQQMSIVGSVLSSQDIPLMGQLSDLALQIGADTKYSATEGAAAIGELAKAGISATDILNGAAMGAANLAAAGGQSIPEAATAMANAMNMFGLSGSQATTVADNFAAAANASSADVGDLTAALAQGGPSAAALGISLDQTIASLALFSNYGIKGSDAGTSLKTMLSSLTNPTGEAATALSGLGFSVDDFVNSANPMAYLADKLQTGLAGMTAAQQQATLQTIFGADAQRVANVLFKEGAAGVENMTAATNDAGAAQRISAKQMDNFKGSMEQLRGTMETISIVIGKTLLPYMKKLADFGSTVGNAFLKLAPPFQKFVAVLGVAAAGFLGLGAAVGLAGPLLATVGAGIAAIAAPILLITGLVAALYLAWSTNFLGIRDIVSGAVSGIIGFFQDFVTYMKEVESTGRILNDSLSLFPASLQGIAIVLATVVDGFIDFARTIGNGGSLSEAWNQLTDRFSNPVFLDALKAIPGQILDAFLSIPWGDIGSAILSGLSTAAGYIGTGSMWLLSHLGDLATDLGSWLATEAGKVDWGGKLSAAASRAGDITGTIIGKLGNLGVALTNWLTQAASQVPWGNIANGAKDVVGSIISKIGDLAAGFNTWYTNAINSVQWNSLGQQVGEKIGSLAQTLAPKALELIEGFATAIQNNWQKIPIALGALLIGVPAAILYLGALLAPKALEFIQGFVTGLGVNWPLVGQWLQGLPASLLAAVPGLAEVMGAKALELINGLVTGLNNAWPMVAAWLGLLGSLAFAAVGELLSTLVPKGVDLITGAVEGLNITWPRMRSWLALLGSMAFQAVSSLVATLVPRGVELIQGALTGLNNQWPTMRSWLSLLGSLALAAVGSLASTLISRGAELISGILSGLNNTWPMVQGWLGQIGAIALAAVPDLGDVLYGAGASLIGGLIGGIQSMIPSLESVLGGITGKLTAWKGPPKRDAVILYPNGQLIMGGLIRGIESYIPILANSLGDITDMLQVGGSGGFSGAVDTFGQNAAALSSVQGPGGQTVIQQTIYIDARFDDVEQMVEAGRFVRDLNTTRQLYVGGIPNV